MSNMLFIQYYQKRNLRIHQRNKGIWELKIISEIVLSSMANQVWQIFGTDAPTPPTCAHGRHHQSITRFFCWTLIDLQNYFQFSERTIDLDRPLQLQVIEINRNHLEEIRRDFIQTCKGDPKKVKHNNVTRDQEATRTLSLISVCFCLLVSLFLSAVRLSLHCQSAWGHVATHSTRVDFSPPASYKDYFWILTSNSRERLCAQVRWPLLAQAAIIYKEVTALKMRMEYPLLQRREHFSERAGWLTAKADNPETFSITVIGQ